MKDKDFDAFIRGFITKYLNNILIGFLLLSSVVVRYHLMKHGSSADFEGYIIPWVEEYRKSIPLAFKEGVGNYYIPYNILLAIASLIDIPINYSVGSISCIFDYLTCLYIYKILSDNFGEKINKLTAAAVSVAFLFVPTIVLNGATWKQCDSIYTFFCVVLLKCLMDGKMRTAFVMLGVAFSFKQQAIFIVPLIIILYFLNDKIKIVYGLYTILVYLIAGLPAIILGRPAAEVYSIYLDQASTYHQMTLNYPNIFLIAMTQYEKMHIYAKLFTVCVFAFAFWFIVHNFKSLTNKNIVLLATWGVWTSCMFLPSMHQRYDYMVAVLLVVCVPLLIAENSWKAVLSAVLFYIGNIITYSYSLFGDDYNSHFVVCCNVIAYFIFCFMFWKCLREDAELNNT